MAASLGSLKYGFGVTFIHDTVWYMLLFLAPLMLLSLALGWRGGQRSREALVHYVLGGTVIRLVLSVIGIYVALQLGVADRLTFVLNFMTLYFIFLTFEIYGLMTTLRANFENPT